MGGARPSGWAPMLMGPLPKRAPPMTRAIFVDLFLGTSLKKILVDLFWEHIPAAVTDKWLLHPTGVGGWLFGAKGDRRLSPINYAPAPGQFCSLPSDVLCRQ